MRVATQPVEAHCARFVVQLQPTSTGSEEVRPVDQSLTSKKTGPVTATGVSAHSDMDLEDDQLCEPGSPAAASEEQDELSDRDTPGEEDLDQKWSEEAKNRETMRGVWSFMGWHPVLDFDTSSSSLNGNPFAASRTQLTGKVSVKLPADE